MKKILFIAAVFVLSCSSAFANPGEQVNQKVLKIFKTSFPEVRNASWHTTDDYYQVFFKNNDCTTRIQYDFSGNLLSTLCNYNGSKLPAFLRAKISSRFRGKSIYGVTELTTPTDHSYNVVLQDNKFWYNVSCDGDGNVFLQNKFKKA